ncbi:MAG TPA: histidine kinase [Solirubrobacteraceae bacterium]|nr:histidine kinase [Solirubrobacteraceae bacterium]
MYAVVREADDRAWRSAYIHAVSHLSLTLRRSVAQNPMVLDTALALALTGWALAEPVTLAHAGRAVVLLAMTIAIAWLRTAPLAVLAVEVMGVALVTEHFQWPQGVAVLSAAYVATFFGEKRLVVGVLLVGLSAWLLAFGGTVRIQRGLVPLVLVAPVWLAGTAMRRREQRAAASTERADRLEREREAMLRAERARIARELHDVVTHSVSVMVLQTGAARQIMTKDEQRLRELLESVETSGRSALEELRRLLGLLSDEDREAPLAPQPGVTEIPSLIEQVRHAGMNVELRVEGQPREISGGIAIAAYRIVQEALTNVLKHAGGASSRVVLCWRDFAIELEIIDDGSPDELTDREARPGRGIVGMRERAEMYGGTLDAHAEPEHGFVVRARIPLERHCT